MLPHLCLVWLCHRTCQDRTTKDSQDSKESHLCLTALDRCHREERTAGGITADPSPPDTICLNCSPIVDVTDHCPSTQTERTFSLIALKRCLLSYLKSHLLTCRYKFVRVNDEFFLYATVSYRLSWRSVLRTVLFTLFMLPLGNIIINHSIHFHCYADR